MQERTWYLYRWFDDDDVLLYLGITVNPRAREAHHRGYAWWAQWAARVEVSPVGYASEAEARAAEVAAIAEERPVFNLADNPGGYRRRPEYLARRGHEGPTPYDRLVRPNPKRHGSWLPTGHCLAELLREQISSAQFAAGDLLVINQIGRRHHVSWRQAKDALTRLASDGLLEDIGHGFRVTSPLARDSASVEHSAATTAAAPVRQQTDLRATAFAMMRAARLMLGLDYDEWGRALEQLWGYRVRPWAPENWETKVVPPGDLLLLVRSILELDPSLVAPPFSVDWLNDPAA